jgi:hypothetical protein
MVRGDFRSTISLQSENTEIPEPSTTILQISHERVAYHAQHCLILRLTLVVV